MLAKCDPLFHFLCVLHRETPCSLGKYIGKVMIRGSALAHSYMGIGIISRKCLRVGVLDEPQYAHTISLPKVTNKSHVYIVLRC